MNIAVAGVPVSEMLHRTADEEVSSVVALNRNVEVTAITSIDECLSLKDEWLELEQNNSGADFFQSWYWTERFLRHIEKDPRSQPFILTARMQNRLIALLPLSIQNRKFRSCLTGLAEPYQQYTEMLVFDGADTKEIFSGWLEEIKKTDVDYLQLGQVRTDSHLFQAMNGLVSPSGEQEAAPFVDLSVWKDFEAYSGSLNRKTRKTMRNAHNRLAKTDRISHSVFYNGSDLQRIMENVYEGRRSWLHKNGLTSRAFSDPDFKKFVSQLKDSDNCQVQMIATELKHGDATVAEQIGFIHKNCYYAFMSGWNPEYEQISPGRMHLGEILKTCYAMNLQKADFMIPAVPYKFTWAKEAIGVSDYVLPLTMRGFAYNRIWLNLLRPIAKTLIYKLPKGFRSKLFKVLKR